MDHMFDPTRPGPFYEDFSVGATLPSLPSVTLTAADNTIYRAITGDQHALAADTSLYAAVSGHADSALANPGVVMHYAMGQTTMATRQAVANLYYRSVRSLRPVELGQTLSTVTTVLGLRDSTPKGDQHRGKVWLGIVTSSEDGPVLEFERCALIRGRTTGLPGHDDDIPGPSEPADLASLTGVPDWDLTPLPASDWSPGDERTDPLRDHIDMAAPFARVTFNQAAVHRDVTLAANGQRLVYGGHVQGLAQASLTRMLPGLATVPAWDGCDHLGPAHEGELVEFRHRLVDSLPAGQGKLQRFETIGTKLVGEGAPVEILRWTPIVWSR
jgi:2-methylfumaryl-CoA hydratase